MRNDAAIGVTFTSLFAVGVVLISLYASNVDLDLDCVLYGVIEYTPLYRLVLAGRDFGPQAFWQMAAVFALVVATVTLLFKELKIAAFDPEMATAVGINATLLHYILMGLVSVTTVGAFEPVGAILVVAMLVVPPATAYLLTDDLKRMLFIAVTSGVLSSILGYFLAQRLDASTAGAMTIIAGAQFALALGFSPRHGIVPKRMAQSACRAKSGAKTCCRCCFVTAKAMGMANRSMPSASRPSRASKSAPLRSRCKACGARVWSKVKMAVSRFRRRAKKRRANWCIVTAFTKAIWASWAIPTTISTTPPTAPSIIFRPVSSKSWTRPQAIRKSIRTAKRFPTTERPKPA